MRSLNKRLYDIWLVPKSKQQTSCALRDSLLSIDFDDLSDGGDKKHTTKKEAHWATEKTARCLQAGLLHII